MSAQKPTETQQDADELGVDELEHVAGGLDDIPAGNEYGCGNLSVKCG